MVASGGERSFRGLQRKAVGFDHGVGQQFFAHLRDAGLRFLLGDSLQQDLHVLAEMHVLHLGIAEIVEGLVDRLALGVEHAFFQGDVNFSEHVAETSM